MYTHTCSSTVLIILRRVSQSSSISFRMLATSSVCAHLDQIYVKI